MMLAYLFSFRQPAAPVPIPVLADAEAPAFADAAHADPAQVDFAVLTTGLRQLLAKWPPDVSRRAFPLATQVYNALRAQSRLRRNMRVPAQLLSDVCHEIAEYVDAPIRQAAVRCLRRSAAS